MFCQHCGHQLPEGSRFCDNCGKMVSQGPQTACTPPQYQQSQQQNVPYTEPVNYKTGGDPQKTPGYNHSAYQWEPPKQHPPVYTEPVHNSQNNQQIPYTKPVEETGYQPNTAYIPPYSYNPVNQSGGYSQQSQQPQQPKRVRKLPILLGTVAVAAILVIVITGGKIEKPKAEKPDNPTIATTQTGGSEKKPGTGKQDKEPASTTPKFGTAKKQLGKNAVRFDSEGFCFDLDGLKSHYAEVLEENGSPFTIGGTSTFTEGDDDVFFWLQNDAGADVVDVQVVRDVVTNRITKVYASQRWLEEGYEDVTEDEINACLLMIPACYGPLTEDQWNSIIEQPPTSETEKNAIYDIDFDGMSVWIHLGYEDNAFTVGCIIRD